MATSPEDNEYLKAMRAKAKAMGAKLMRVGDTPSMLGSGINNKYIAVISQPEYGVGDLLIFENPRGGLTIHPATHKRQKPGVMPMGADDTAMEFPAEFYTKGTSNKWGDGWVPQSRIQGKMLKILDPEKSVTTTKKSEKALTARK